MPTPPVWATGMGRVRSAPIRPAASLTLDELGTTEGLGRLVALLGANTDGDERTATLNALHTALAIVVRLVVEPFVIDGLAISGAGSQFGVCLGGTADEAAFWVGDVVIAPIAEPELVGDLVGRLMRPVMTAVRTRARVGRTGIELVVLDGLTSRVQRAGRRSAIERPDGWIEALIAAAGLPSDLPRRSLEVAVDDGTPVRFALPRVCCVLSRRASSHACPTCPKLADDEARRWALTDWVSAMSDDEFFETTGRRRVAAGKG